MSRTGVASPSGRNASALIAVAAFSCLVVTLLQSLIVPAVPRFPSLVNSSATTVSWMVTATLLTGAIATPVMGRLGDLFPRRRVMVVTMAFVFVGSVIAPLGGITTIIIGRALQGAGTALIPVAMAEMRHSLPGTRIGGALALLSAMLGIGGGLGIPIGGVILSAIGWEAMFWFAAIMSAASIILILAVIPRDDSAPSGSFDVPGAVLLGLSLTALLTAVSQGATWGWVSAITLSLFIGGSVLGVMWAKYELGQTSPLVNLRTTADRPILLTNLASILLGTLMFTNLLLTTLELQNPPADGGFGWSATSAGLAMLPSAAAMFAVAPISARLAAAYGPRVVVTVGSAITAAGYLLRLAYAPSGSFVVAWATVVAIGVGIGYAGLPMMIVQYVPAHETGSANAVNALMRSIGMAGSSAMVAAITAALAVAHGGGTVPSSSALDLLAGIGIGMGIVSVILSASSKRRGEDRRGGHHATLDAVASDAAR
ncbi:MFS transporter [Corynebacterium xerosis]|uniref:MFS transporter n=1 Tax=Corynebacterium xerosis TaxID=1725 RepID=UPI0023F76F00|nr:MFS transporter [Corynebacterium xerosis]